MSIYSFKKNSIRLSADFEMSIYSFKLVSLRLRPDFLNYLKFNLKSEILNEQNSPFNFISMRLTADLIFTYSYNLIY